MGQSSAPSLTAKYVNFKGTHKEKCEIFRRKVNVCMYPVTRLDLADDPEEEIDVEEEESIG